MYLKLIFIKNRIRSIAIASKYGEHNHNLRRKNGYWLLPVCLFDYLYEQMTVLIVYNEKSYSIRIVS